MCVHIPQVEFRPAKALRGESVFATENSSVHGVILLRETARTVSAGNHKRAENYGLFSLQAVSLSCRLY